MKYRKGYKYQLHDDYSFPTLIFNYSVDTDYLSLKPDGLLTAKKGYAWDGPSGPTVDTKSFMRGSLLHDVIYQLIREGYIPKRFKDYADRLLRLVCVADGMTRLRAWYVYQAVKYFADFATRPESIKPIIEV